MKITFRERSSVLIFPVKNNSHNYEGKNQYNHNTMQCFIVSREVKCVSRCSISNYCEENSKNNANYLYCIPEITYNCGLPAPKTVHVQKNFMPKASNTKANHFPS